jgi:hypothetical protein
LHRQHTSQTTENEECCRNATGNQVKNKGLKPSRFEVCEPVMQWILKN